jgi:hypothetical protein
VCFASGRIHGLKNLQSTDWPLGRGAVDAKTGLLAPARYCRTSIHIGVKLKVSFHGQREGNSFLESRAAVLLRRKLCTSTMHSVASQHPPST